MKSMRLIFFFLFSLRQTPRLCLDKSDFNNTMVKKELKVLMISHIDWREENETFFIKMQKLLPNRRILKS